MTNVLSEGFEPGLFIFISLSEGFENAKLLEDVRDLDLFLEVLELAIESPLFAVRLQAGAELARGEVEHVFQRFEADVGAAGPLDILLHAFLHVDVKASGGHQVRAFVFSFV